MLASYGTACVCPWAEERVYLSRIPSVVSALPGCRTSKVVHAICPNALQYLQAVDGQR